MPVKYTFKGKVDNEEIKKFYRNIDIACFITTSASEGLPVSIMEAMSYGIPVIATNVGGISELIEDNGILLSGDPKIEEVSESLEEILFSDEDSLYGMRKNSYEIWKSKFDANENARLFAEELYRKYGSEYGTIVITIDSVYADWCFAEKEITELSKLFHVILIETKLENDTDKIQYGKKIVDRLDADIELVQYNGSSCAKVIYFPKYWADKHIITERDSVRKEHREYTRLFWESMKYYASSEMFYSWLKKNNIIAKEHPVVFYSFWQQNTTLAVCRHKGNNAILSRAHGYDLYDARYTKGGRQPFREYMDPLLDEVFFVSQAGKDYYLDRNKVQANDKYKVRYLGSSATDNNNLNYNKSRDKRIITSCSNLISLKRVDIIIDALADLSKKHPDIDIEWVHFGDGPLMDELKGYADSRLGERNV